MSELLVREEALPPSSAELVLYRAHVEALLSVLGRRKSEKYLRAMAEKLAWEEGLSTVFQIRSTREHGAVRKAQRQAAAIFEAYWPIFVAALPSK